MSIWTIEPRDRLILGDGRPKDAVGHRAASLDLPLPTTLAGALRAKIGRDRTGHFGLTTEEALDIEVHGPLLRQADIDSGWLVPAPMDALWHKLDGGDFVLRRLRPRRLPAGISSDMPAKLLHVTIAKDVSPIVGKPIRGPGLWRWSEFESWLAGPGEDLRVAADAPNQPDAPCFGMPLPLHDERIHVALEVGGRTAIDGALFSFDGVRLQTHARGRLAITCRCDHENLEAGILTLGGKRQQSFLDRNQNDSWPGIPSDPPGGDVWRLILLTPAVFADGFLPKDKKLFGQEVIAAAVDRPQGLHGWDLRRDERGRPRGPKPLRWMARAGSVYWIKAPESKQERQDLLARMWLQPCSDGAQHRRDGLGLVVVGRA